MMVVAACLASTASIVLVARWPGPVAVSVNLTAGGPCDVSMCLTHRGRVACLLDMGSGASGAARSLTRCGGESSFLTCCAACPVEHTGDAAGGGG